VNQFNFPPITFVLYAVNLLIQAVALWFCRKRPVGYLLPAWIGFSLFKGIFLLWVYFERGAYAEWFWLLQMAQNIITVCLCIRLSGLKYTWISNSIFTVAVMVTIAIGPPEVTRNCLEGSQLVQCLSLGIMILCLLLRKTVKPLDTLAYAMCWIVGLQIACGWLQTEVGLNQWTRALWQITWIAGIGMLTGALLRFRSIPEPL
jgi:hypothetical protein